MANHRAWTSDTCDVRGQSDFGFRDLARNKSGCAFFGWRRIHVVLEIARREDHRCRGRLVRSSEARSPTVATPLKEERDLTIASRSVTSSLTRCDSVAEAIERCALPDILWRLSAARPWVPGTERPLLSANYMSKLVVSKKGSNSASGDQPHYQVRPSLRKAAGSRADQHRRATCLVCNDFDR